MTNLDGSTMTETEQVNRENKEQLAEFIGAEKVLDAEAEHIAMTTAVNDKDRMIISFALGRCYMLCRLLAIEKLGPFEKDDFRLLAKKIGAELY
jgi:hypothetical protein